MFTKLKLLTFFIAISCTQIASPMNFARRARPLIRRTALKPFAARPLLNKRLLSKKTASATALGQSKNNSSQPTTVYSDSIAYYIDKKMNSVFIIGYTDHLFEDLLTSYKQTQIKQNNSMAILKLRYNIYTLKNLCIDILNRHKKESFLLACKPGYTKEILSFFEIYSDLLEEVVKSDDKEFTNIMLEWSLNSNYNFINPKIAYEYIENNKIEDLIKLVKRSFWLDVQMEMNESDEYN